MYNIFYIVVHGSFSGFKSQVAPAVGSRTSGGSLTLMTLFHRSFVESVVTFSLICRCGSITVKLKNSFSKLIKVSSRITGSKQKGLEELYQNQMLKRVESIL